MFKKFGYQKNKSYYYKSFEECYLKFDLEKSNFSNGWYINYSILIKELHTDEDVLNTWKQDLSGRVIVEKDNTATDLIELDIFRDTDELKEKIEKGLIEIIVPFEKNEIQSYIEAFPQMLCTATIGAQEYMVKKGYIKETK